MFFFYYLVRLFSLWRFGNTDKKPSSSLLLCFSERRLCSLVRNTIDFHLRADLFPGMLNPNGGDIGLQNYQNFLHLACWLFHTDAGKNNEPPCPGIIRSRLMEFLFKQSIIKMRHCELHFGGFRIKVMIIEVWYIGSHNFAYLNRYYCLK